MKILIVGLGSIARKHIEAILLILPEAQLYALRSKKESPPYPGINNVFSLEEISGIPLDFAIISTPTSEHKKYIEQLLPFDFPLFIEKPLHSSLDIKDAVERATKRGIITYVACNLRFLGCIRFIKESIKSAKLKRLNEVNVYCGSSLPDWRQGSDFRKSYSAITELGGGVHMDLIHELDYLYWLYGKPKTVNRIFRSQSSLGIESYDYANYVLDYAGFSANVILNYYRKDAKRSLELVFEDETWDVDLLKNEIRCGSEIVYSSEERIQQTYRTQMEYFIGSIATKKETMNPMSEAYDVLEICLPR